MNNKFNYFQFLTSASLILLITSPSLAIANSLKPETPIKKELKNSSVKKNVIAQALETNPDQDVLIPNPTIKIDGKPVEPSQPSPPPFLPRAVAPPVGDMSVSNVKKPSKVIELGTAAKVPRLVLREAPVREVLSLLSRAAGYNIIFTEGGTEGAENTVSLDLENEPVQDVFNNLLMISGLKATIQGQTIFVGNQLPPSIRNTITRSLRLNQYSAVGAASFLNSQGAEGNIVEIDQKEENGKVKQTFSVKPLNILRASKTNNEELVLEGLTVHADPVNNTITLVGDAQLVQMATSFLTQLDVRRRQVAVNVKVVDVQLDDTTSFGANFSFGIDNTGVIQDGGVGVINFGTSNQNVDPNEYRQDSSGNLIPAYDEEIVISEDFSQDLTKTLENNVERSLESVLDKETANNLTDNLTQSFGDTINRTLSQFGNTTTFTRDQIETLRRDLQNDLINNVGSTISQTDLDELTDNVIDEVTNNITRTVTRTLQGTPLGTPNSGRISPFGTTFDRTQPGQSATIRPGSNFNVPQAFIAQIRANISSGNAKILTDPTLVVQEGQIGSVELVENVVTSVETSIDQLSGVRTTTPVLEPAGLTLSVAVNKIDDNGFISLLVNPTISAPGAPQVFSSGDGANNIITPLVERKVSSGLIRLRDSQTLILSGIISDGENVNVSKIPILGDLPIIGSLFRSSVTTKARSEVIVLLTPQIINDSETDSGFGYNYTPSRETSDYLRERGLTIPTTPY